MEKFALETSVARLEFWIQLFAVLVAIGIVGEVGFGVRHWLLTRRLQRLETSEDQQRQEEIARLNKQAGEAYERAGKAEENLAGANSKAASANERAANAEKAAAEANVELARFKAPRTLTRLQQTNVASRLRTFGAKRVDMIIIGDGQEIADIARLIAEAIQQAGWSVNILGKAISGPNVSGVLVGTHVGSAQDIIQAANTLTTALQSEGIASQQFTPQFDDTLPMAIMGNWDSKNVAPIRILVSAKP